MRRSSVSDLVERAVSSAVYESQSRLLSYVKKAVDKAIDLTRRKR